MENKTILSMQKISKKYDDNAVLKNVDLTVKAGEIHALMGENGAGKSTLMNVLFGMPVIHTTGGYEGKVYIDGQEVNIKSPYDAMNYGIGMVHQEFMLIPDFTLSENIKVGREIGNATIFSKFAGKSLDVLDKAAMDSDSRKSLDRIGMGIDEYTKVAGLPVGYKQFVEIAREIDKSGIKLLVFDEPTAVLTESEAERLLAIMKKIASQGIAIIFITHRLDEVMEVADSLTVLRDGETINRVDVKDTSVVKIAEMMIGRKVEKLVDMADDSNRKLSPDDIILEFKDYSVAMPGEDVKHMDVKIRRGEIFGFGGLAGQGKIGVINGIMGLYPSAGSVFMNGEKLNLDKLGEALRKGIAFVSEDRRGIGLLLGESIERNIIFSALEIKGQFLKKFGPISLLDSKASGKHAQNMIELLDIRCTGPAQKSGTLSGGNQQKVCLARALTMDPEILIVAEPTRGIDIGAKKLVLEHLVKINREMSKTIIIISSELVELRSLCDRIAIVSEGNIATILAPDDSDAAYGLAMSGMTNSEKAVRE